MGSLNSIRCNLSKDDIISSIQMSIAGDIKKELTFIVVEGIDDISFWKNKVPDTVSIYESYSGKIGVEKIIEHFNNDSVIGICDRDYDVAETRPNIFYYDFCCLEMMLISQDDVFESIVSEYCYSGHAANALREHILRELLWLSCLRKLNSENAWQIRLKGLSINKVVLNQKFKIDEALKELEKLDSNFITTHRTNLGAVTNICKKEYTVLELLDITQGHDFMCFFHTICVNQSVMPCKHSVDNISASLRCAYRFSDFKNSCLYQSLSEYEQSKSKKFIL